MDISCHSRKCPSAASQWISVPPDAVVLLSHHTSVSSNSQMRVHSIIKYSSLWLLSLKKRMSLKSISAVMCQQWISYCYWVGRNVEGALNVGRCHSYFFVSLFSCWWIPELFPALGMLWVKSSWTLLHKQLCVYIFIFPG